MREEVGLVLELDEEEAKWASGSEKERECFCASVGTCFSASSDWSVVVGAWQIEGREELVAVNTDAVLTATEEVGAVNMFPLSGVRVRTRGWVLFEVYELASIAGQGMGGRDGRRSAYVTPTPV